LNHDMLLGTGAISHLGSKLLILRTRQGLNHRPHKVFVSASTLTVSVSNNIDRKFPLAHIVARLRGHRAALFALVVEEGLEKARRLLGGACCAVLVEGAEGAGAGNLLPGCVAAASWLDIIHDGLEVDEVSGRAV
jgi:hypothetical protein